MALKITLGSGDTHVVKFDVKSTLSVKNLVQQASPLGQGLVDSWEDMSAWSDVTGVEIVDDSQIPAPADPAQLPQETPIEPTPAPVVPAQTPENAAALAAPPAQQTPPDDPTLATPEAAVDHAATLPTDDALTHVEAALVKFPDDPDLLAAKADLDAEAAAPPGA